MYSSHAQMVSLIWSIADDVLVFRRMRRSDYSLYHGYNQNEGFQGNFRKLLRQIIDDKEYREVVHNQNSF